MKRMLVAAAGGVLIPIIYTAAVGTVTDWYYGPDGDMIEWNGRVMPGLWFAPTMLPVYFIEFVLQLNLPTTTFVFINPWFRLTFVVLFNFVLYTLITHAALRRLGWLDKKKGVPLSVLTERR